VLHGHGGDCRCAPQANRSLRPRQVAPDSPPVTKAEQLYEALCLARPGGKDWPKPGSPFALSVVGVLEKELAGAKKEKKKLEIDERAKNIFNVYPNRQGGQAALKSISDSIAEDWFDFVLERTTQYATACARCSQNT